MPVAGLYRNARNTPAASIDEPAIWSPSLMARASVRMPPSVPTSRAGEASRKNATVQSSDKAAAPTTFPVVLMPRGVRGAPFSVPRSSTV